MLEFICATPPFVIGSLVLLVFVVIIWFVYNVKKVIQERELTEDFIVVLSIAGALCAIYIIGFIIKLILC